MYPFETFSLNIPTKHPPLLYRLIGSLFLCEGNEVWNYNLLKPIGERWEYYYSFFKESTL